MGVQSSASETESSDSDHSPRGTSDSDSETDSDSDMESTGSASPSDSHPWNGDTRTGLPSTRREWAGDDSPEDYYGYGIGIGELLKKIESSQEAFATFGTPPQ